MLGAFLARRGGAVEPALVEKATSILEPAYRVFRGILYTAIERGLKPRTNDGIDVTMALPLWQSDWIVITNDQRLIDFARVGGVSPGRFSQLDDFRGLGEGDTGAL